MVNVMLKLVFFDLDGTIADTIPMCIDAFGKAIFPYTGHSLSKDEIIQTFGLNEIGMIKSIVKENWEKALQDFYIKYEELHFQCDIPFEGIIELIEMLKSKGILVALVTGKGQKSCDITLQRLKMNNMFSDIMTGSEYRNCKKDLMLELINKYNLSEEECLYIGDAISDVTISNELGVTCFSAAWAQSTNKSKLYEINAENVFESVLELTRTLNSLV